MAKDIYQALTPEQLYVFDEKMMDEGHTDQAYAFYAGIGEAEQLYGVYDPRQRVKEQIETVLYEWTPAMQAAHRIVNQLLTEPTQLKLFNMPSLLEDIYGDDARDLQNKNPRNLVIPADKVDQYRYYAAYLGAGFNLADYEDIMYIDNDPAEIGRRVVDYLGIRIFHVPPKSPSANRMRDEVHEVMFSDVIPSTIYSRNHYITSPADLRKIMAYDYENLEACQRLDFDLLYERED